MVTITEMTTRRRNNNRRRANTTTTVARVVTRKQPRRRNARRAMIRPDPCGQRYLKCLFGAEGGAVKIPDGDNKHSVAIEFRQTQTLTPTSGGNLTVMCMPGLPGSMRILEGGGTFMDAAGTQVTVPNVYPTGMTIAYPDFQATINNSISPSRFANDDVVVRSARVVSYKLEVTQVGAVLNQQGVVATARIPSLAQSRTIVPAYINMSAANALYTGATYVGLTGPQPIMLTQTGGLLDFNHVSTYPTVKMCNATEPCLLLGKGCGEWVPSLLGGSAWHSNNGAGDTVLYVTNPIMQSVYDSTGTVIVGGCFGVVNNSTTSPVGGNVKIPILPALADTTLLGDFWVDPECEALIWSGDNLGTNTLFQARVTVCMELEVDYGASVYRPLVTPPAPMDSQALAVADKAMAIMPASVSKAEGSQSWWNALTTGVTGIAEIVGGLGMPVLSPAANLGLRMAKMLGL